jgi:histidyl-tRNA synthetase
MLLAMDAPAPPRPKSCFLAPIGERAAEEGLRVAAELRSRGIRAELDGRGGSLKSLLRRADALGATLCLVLGEAELERGVVQIKNLAAHSQAEVPRAGVADYVQANLGADEAAR